MGAAMSLGRSPLLPMDGPQNEGTDNIDDEIEEMKKEKVLDEGNKVFELVGKSDHAFLTKLFLDWQACTRSDRTRYVEKLGLSTFGMRKNLQLKEQFESA